MATRYNVLEKGEQGTTAAAVGQREFYVYKGDRARLVQVPVVWVGNDGIPRCVACSGLLSAMLASCPHAKAVKRFLKREKPSTLK